MIVPRTKLLALGCDDRSAVCPVGAVVPGALPISLGAIGLLFVTVVIDAFMSSKALAGINVELAEVTRMSKDRETKLEIRIRNERQIPAHVAHRPASRAKSHLRWSKMMLCCPCGKRMSRHAWPACRQRR